jgi:hypothetical protein
VSSLVFIRLLSLILSQVNFSQSVRDVLTATASVEARVQLLNNFGQTFDFLVPRPKQGFVSQKSLIDSVGDQLA